MAASPQQAEPSQPVEATQPVGRFAPAVVVGRITVKSGRIAFEVRVPDPRIRTVGVPLAKRCLSVHPDLARHACVNGETDTFGPVIVSTSLPHLLEHLAIDIEAHAAGDAATQTTYVGATTWADESNGQATVELSFVDDLATLDAFNRAVRFVNAAIADLGADCFESKKNS